MKPLLILLLPLTLFAQHDDNPCGAIGWTQVGAVVSFLKPQTVGFQLARHQPVNQSSLYVGLGAEVLHGERWLVPLSFHLTYVALTSSPSPVVQVSPGYLIGGREQVSGFTLFGGVGLVFAGNGLLMVGYQKLGNGSGVGVRVGVML